VRRCCGSLWCKDFDVQRNLDPGNSGANGRQSERLSHPQLLHKNYVGIFFHVPERDVGKELAIRKAPLIFIPAAMV
jgi:hypothetical protein